MNQVLEFLAENYIYVAGGSAIIIVILLIIIAFGNKKGKKKDSVSNGVNEMPNMQSNLGGANASMGIPEPVLESVPVAEAPVEPIPTVEPVAPVVEPQVSVPVAETPVVTEEKKEDLEVFDL